MGILNLSPELIVHIWDNAPKEDLLLCALISKSFNSVITPLIYRHILLQDRTHALKCLEILTDEEVGRARFVQMISLDCLPEFPYQRFLDGLALMSNLRRYRCMMSWGFCPDICATLAQSCLLLESITTCIGQEANFLGWDISIVQRLRPHFRHLTTFEFSYDSYNSVPNAYKRFLRYLLKTHCTTLTKLSLTVHPLRPNFLAPFLSDTYQYLHMDHLVIDPYALPSDIGRTMPALRSLAFTGVPFAQTALARALSTPLPMLQRLSNCSANHLPHLLPHMPSLQRLQLDGAIHPLVLDGYADCTSHRMGSHELDELLQCLGDVQQHMSRIREIALAVRALDFADLPMLVPYILRTEVVVLSVWMIEPAQQDSLKSLGETFFSRMKLLRTLLINDTEYSWKKYQHLNGHPFQRELLQQWGTFCPTLQVFSFQGRRTWIKQASGEWIKHKNQKIPNQSIFPC